ncbi:MAG: DEAD/DEAH box helicase [Sphingobacteriia bacterium]|nr:DEAD/DEAH box helicase [Sphingobacteriia bacterium]
MKTKPIFAVLVQEHARFGKLIYFFLLVDSGKNYLEIVDRISVANLDFYRRHLSPGMIEIVGFIEEYSDKLITRRFTNKKIASRDFIQNLDPEYIEKFVRPFIEKQIAKCISLIAKEGLPFFYRESKNVVSRGDQIIVEDIPATIVFNFIKLPDETRYFQTIRHKDKVISLKGKNGLIFTNKPCWLMLDQHLYHFIEEVDGKKLEVFFEKEYIAVPSRVEKDYYSTFIKKCIRDFPVYTEGISISFPEPKRQALLSLENDLEGDLSLLLYYVYDKKEISGAQQLQTWVIFNGDTSNPSFEVFRRDWIWEQQIAENLLKMGLQQQNTGRFYVQVNPTHNQPNQKYELVEWMNYHTNAVKNAGIGLRQQMGQVSYFSGHIEMELGIKESNDWFDIYAVAKFGEDIEIPVYKLRHHLIEGIREYVLPDGRIAILPEEWFKKFTGLVLFGSKTSKGVTISKARAAMVQEAFDESNSEILSTLDTLSRKFLAAKPEIPKGLNAVLRSYQLEGLQWFRFLKKVKLGGCLADDMGLGKTLQTIALLLKRKEELMAEQLPMKPNPSLGQLNLFSEIEKQFCSHAPSLVIMPASLIHNWESELEKFAPSLVVVNYTGPQRIEMLTKFTCADLILTTYGVIRNDLPKMEAVQFDYIILDESQIIKNPKSKITRSILKLNANLRITLSGTPIENNLTDLWSQMNFLNRGLLGDLSFFRRYFAVPIEKNQDHDRLEKLQTLVNPLILRRTKAEVEKELPALSEDVVYCEMMPEQQKIYLEEKSKIRNFILQQIEENGSSNAALVVLQGLTKLRQIANHPAMVYPDYRYPAGKFEEVIRNLETLLSGGHKVLVFSSFVKHLEIFANTLKSRKIDFCMLTGNTVKRKEVIMQFRQDKNRNVFLISLKAGGVGLNLTQAGYVFLLEPWWNPAVEMQAISRSHRIGQTSHVFAYRYISIGTIEEKILRLQQKKSRLSELFVRSDNPLKHLNVNDIKELID